MRYLEAVETCCVQNSVALTNNSKSMIKSHIQFIKTNMQ